MTVNTPGSYLMEPVGRETALPAKAATFVERRRIGVMPEESAGGKAGVAVGPNKNNNPREINVNKKGESHESRFRSSE